MRTFLGKPTLAAEGDDYEEKAAAWFELFFDLVLVAACSSISDAFAEDFTVSGFYSFFVCFGTVTTGWHAYTRFTTRFNENTVLHGILMAIMLTGFSGMAIAVVPVTLASYLPHCILS